MMREEKALARKKGESESETERERERERSACEKRIEIKRIHFSP
jgi:hypothetical protein